MRNRSATQMSRREFIAAGGAAFSLRHSRAAGAEIHTVMGPVRGEELGSTLIHEHVLVDFIGADQIKPGRYDVQEVIEVVQPYLVRIRELGCQTLVECTPAWLGRDPLLLKRLSEASGLRMITNTGYYGASNGKYLPAHAREETAGQLARRWIREFRNGIDETGVVPGIMKIGVNRGPLSDVDAKLVRAAAQAHRETGLTVACHTGDGAAAMQELEIFQEEGVSPRALIWVHAQNEKDPDVHANAARKGAWVEFEGVNESSLAARVAQVKTLIDRGFCERVLVSLDAGWYRVGEPGGGKFSSYGFFYARFLPALQEAGVTEAQIRLLTIENPRRALEIAIRLS